MSARQRPAWGVSPSLAAMPDGVVPAYEMKFVVPEPTAAAAEAWAADHLAADPHADPARGNRYRVTSVYLDTPGWHVLRRADGYAVHKHRVRRYGGEPVALLERKSKRDGRVWKCRTPVPLGALAGGLPEEGPAAWFAREAADLGLRPVCQVTYERAAFVGGGPCGPIRLTLDRAAVGRPAAGFRPDPAAGGVSLLGGEVVVELKFLSAMPAVFKGLVESLRLVPAGVSKYRRFAAAAGLIPAEAADAPVAG